MDSKRKKRRFLWIVRLVGAGLTCFSGILIGVYLARLEIANFITNQALMRSGFPDSKLRISHLDQSNCIIKDLHLNNDSYELNIDSLHIQFDITEAWNNKTLQTLHIAGVKFRYDLTDPSTFDPQELDALIKDGIPFPLYSLEVEDASIILLTGIGEISFSTILSLSKIGVSEIQGNVNVRSELDTLDIDFQITDQIDFYATASSTDLTSSLATYNLPLLGFESSTVLETSSGSVNARGSFIGIEPQPIDFKIVLGPVSYDDSIARLSIDSISSHMVFESNEIKNINTNIHFQEIRYDAYKTQESIIRIDAPTLQTISIAVPETHWLSNNGDHGIVSANIEAQLNEDFTIDKGTVSGQSTELVTDTLEFAPFQFSLAGNLDAATLTTSTLVAKAFPWLKIETLNARLDNLSTEQPSIELTATVNATDDESSDSEPPLTGSWKLASSIQPNAQPQVLNLSIQSIDDHPILGIQSYLLNGSSQLEMKFRHWSEENLAALDLTLNGTNLNADLPFATFQGISLNATFSSQPISIPDVLASKGAFNSLIPLLVQYTKYEFELQGAEFTVPDIASIQWFSGTFNSDYSDSQLQAKLELGIGIANIETESVKQIAIKSNISTDARNANVETAGEMLFEGEPVTVESRQTFDFSKPSFASKGEYSVRGILLTNSDLLSRRIPSLIGTIVSADLAIEGSLELEDEQTKTPAILKLSNGSVLDPANDVSIDSIQTNIVFDSIADLVTRPSQTITIDTLTFGDIEATDMLLEFELDENNQFFVEKAQMHSFDGILALDPFNIDLDDPQAAITLRFEQISIAPVMTMLDFFEGEVTGRLDGVLPISIVDGLPVLGEGFLELDPKSDAQFAYDAQGFFTQPDDPYAPPKTFGDKMLERLGLEPNALLEDALGNLNIVELQMDLFSKDLPGTPMRIQMAGLAETGTARIPLNITTNINGTVAELLNFLMRLNSLGAVPETDSL